jgi:hypothetical protein
MICNVMICDDSYVMICDEMSVDSSVSQTFIHLFALELMDDCWAQNLLLTTTCVMINGK